MTYKQINKITLGTMFVAIVGGLGAVWYWALFGMSSKVITAWTITSIVLVLIYTIIATSYNRLGGF